MPALNLRDDIARRNLELTRIAIEQGEYGEPYLDLDVEAFREYREGVRADPPLRACRSSSTRFRQCMSLWMASWPASLPPNCLPRIPAQRRNDPLA
ncbi:MAG: hypothetical protein ACYTDY_08080 [Planctomycetota bacterium]|jgi:hypothetical protein